MVYEQKLEKEVGVEIRHIFDAHQTFLVLVERAGCFRSVVCPKKVKKRNVFFTVSSVVSH
jgi:hypothetical protein